MVAKNLDSAQWAKEYWNFAWRAYLTFYASLSTIHVHIFISSSTIHIHHIDIHIFIHHLCPPYRYLYLHLYAPYLYLKLYLYVLIHIYESCLNNKDHFWTFGHLDKEGMHEIERNIWNMWKCLAYTPVVRVKNIRLAKNIRIFGKYKNMWKYNSMPRLYSGCQCWKYLQETGTEWEQGICNALSHFTLLHSVIIGMRLSNDQWANWL